MTDFRTGTRNIQDEFEHFVGPESEEILINK